MNKDDLVKRVGEIEAGMQQNRTLFNQHNQATVQLNAEYNAMEGARQECHRYLSQILDAESKAAQAEACQQEKVVNA